MRTESAKPDAIVAEIAARQHGVVHRRQLTAGGISETGVARRIELGRLHRVHRGVYAVGHPGLSQEGRWMAAVLACGDGAVLSHRSAAALWSLLSPSRGQVDVSIPTVSGRRKQAGIHIHRRTTLTPAVVTRQLSIPVTSPAQTIADLRRAVSPAQLRRAIREAEVRGLQTGLNAPPEPTRSELEHRFLGVCKRQGLPPPEVNVRLGFRIVDFLWRDARLVVETDGYRFHRGSTAFEDDHERDLELRTAGFDVIHLSYRQVTTNPRRVAAIVGEALKKGDRRAS